MYCTERNLKKAYARNCFSQEAHNVPRSRTSRSPVASRVRRLQRIREAGREQDGRERTGDSRRVLRLQDHTRSLRQTEKGGSYAERLRSSPSARTGIGFFPIRGTCSGVGKKT